METSEENSKIKRPRRAKTNQITYDEDELLLRELRKAELKDLNVFEDLSETNIDQVKTGAWTDDEISSFHHARIQLDPSLENYWEIVSQDFVKTKTPSECQERWLDETSSGDLFHHQRKEG